MHENVIVGLLGLGAAFVNGASRLVATTLADQHPTPRQVKRAWAQFAIALFFGPIAAVVFTPIIQETWHITHAPPVAVAVGLTANALWPVFVEGIVPAFKTALGGWLTSLGAALGKPDGATNDR